MLGTVGDRLLGVRLLIGRHRPVADDLGVAEVVGLHQVGRERVAAPMALAPLGVDLDPHFRAWTLPTGRIVWRVTVNKDARDWARPVVHWEIEARDPERQKAFYGELFNWNIGDGFIMAIEPGLGGPEPGPAGHLRESERSGVTLYVQVRDLKEALAKAVELGGSVVAEPFDVPDGPTLAGIADPEGNPVTLVQQ